MGVITQEKLRAVYGIEEGDKLLKDLENKNRGGRNNAKGTLFELFYAIYQIARYFNTGTDNNTVLFSSQIMAFVDDLLIEQPAIQYACCHQLKDVESLSWTSGEPSLEYNFSRQHACTSEAKGILELKLVVSNKDLFVDLLAKMPAGQRGKVQVEHFISANSMNNLIRLNDHFRTELSKMCALKHPSADKLEALGMVLMGVWECCTKFRISLSEIVDKCHRINPHFIMGLSGDISKKLSGVLNAIPGFNYIVTNGYLEWEFNKTDSGIVPFPIGSFEFEQWENDVFDKIIHVFDDIEPLLSF